MKSELKIICFTIFMSTILISTQKEFCPFPQEENCPHGCSNDDDCKPFNLTKCCYGDKGCCVPSFQCKSTPFKPVSCSACSGDSDCTGRSVTCCATAQSGCCVKGVKPILPETNKRDPNKNKFCVTAEHGAKLEVTEDTYTLKCDPSDSNCSVEVS